MKIESKNMNSYPGLTMCEAQQMIKISHISSAHRIVRLSDLTETKARPLASWS